MSTCDARSVLKRTRQVRKSVVKKKKLTGYEDWPYGPHIHPWADFLEPGYLDKRRAEDERILKKLEKYDKADQYLPVSYIFLINIFLYMLCCLQVISLKLGFCI